MDVREQVRSMLCEQFPDWTDRMGPDRVVALDALPDLAKSALLNELDQAPRHEDLPATFVPGRNILFFTFGAIHALQRGIKTLVAGMCETDYSGYPDCRDDSIKALQVAINLGMDVRLSLVTPLMWVDKAGTWDMAHKLGGDVLIELIRKETHTCYVGDRVNWHAWGYGCGTCDACRLRSRGWESFAGTQPITDGATHANS